MYSIPAVILAGGKSSRMGRDKALLPFAGYATLSEFQYVKLQGCFHQVYLSTKEDKFDFPCHIIEDNSDVSSPLIALVSVFEKLQADTVFVLSVDTPLVNEEVIKTLYDAHSTAYDAIVAVHKNGSEALCAIYNRSIIAKAKDAISKERHALYALLKQSQVKYVFFDNNEWFTNLNYPEAYEKLCLR